MKRRPSPILQGKSAVDVLVHFPQRSAEPSSMSHYCDLLVEGLTKLGYRVEVLSKSGLIATTEGPVWRTILNKTPAILSTWPELLRQHFKYPDRWFIHVSQEYIPPFAASRSINIIHDLIQIQYPRSRLVGFFYRHVLPLVARRAALNISVSQCTASQLAEMKILSRVVYNEFKISDPPALGSTERGPTKYAACWVGNLARHKNIGDYLAAAAAMPQAEFAVVLPEAHSRRLGSELVVPSNVRVFSSLGDDSYHALLAASKFLVSTSLVEGFGRPPADGALAGCDLILSDIAIYRELYDGLAHFYRPGDIDDLVAQLAMNPAHIYDGAHRRFKDWNSRNNLVDVIDETISLART